MQRRTLLRLGAATGTLLALAGAGVALWQPGWRAGQLTTEGRELFNAISRAVLDGLLPNEGPARDAALTAQLSRIEDTVNGFPRAVQDELSQLLALLCTAPGRIGLAGVNRAWTHASTAEVQQALQALRVSSINTRQQVYLALRDLSYGAFFADPGSWKATGYPGPLAISAISGTSP